MQVLYRSAITAITKTVVALALGAIGTTAPATAHPVNRTPVVTTPSDASSPTQQAILGPIKQLLAAGTLPPQVQQPLQNVVAFLDGSRGGGPPIPRNGPVIAQFLYPSVGRACIGDTADSVATALAVPGPATLPPPGPRSGQTGFVFTALGTRSPAARQPTPMTVTWFNLDTHQSHTDTLSAASHINPNGPATLTTVVNTGPGRVIAIISGGLTTAPTPTTTRSCNFFPTAGIFTVR